MRITNKAKKETKFSTIYYNKKDKNISKTISQLRKAYNFNKKLYKKEIGKFNTIIVYSRREYNEYHSSKKTKKFHIASARKDQRLLILSPNKIERWSTYTKKESPQILKHEINHLFYYNLYKASKPWWLNEGLALIDSKYKPEKNLLLMKKLKQKIKKENLLIYEQNKKNRKFVFKNSRLIYPLAYLMTQHLREKYGIPKIKKLLKKYSKQPNQKIFNKLFKQTFKKTQDKIIKELPNWLEKND